MIALIASALLLVGSLLALPALVRQPPRGSAFVAYLTLLACAIGAVAAGHAAVTGVDAALSVPWQPFGSLALHLDALSGLFLLPIFVIGALGAVYGNEYLERGEHHRSGVIWIWYALFIASMAVVVLAANAVLFLIAWEAMSVVAFFLVTHEDDSRDVRYAGWVFLIAAHIGTASLIAMFAVLGRGAEAMDFTQLRGADGGLLTGAVVVLALIGFGVKAGLVPAHIWLPIAHPAAPSHVSALMSGAMLNVGIYGFVRVLLLLPAVPAWTGVVLLALGLGSAVYGVLLALAQHDLKRLLAFSSVENMGIVCTGLGVGMLGRGYHLDAVATLGYAGALLHVVNHAVFKSLLFLDAGAVQRATGTREIDHLGGLLRPLPWTGTTFFVGAAAICGLPPFNGFVAEFLIYLGAASGLVAPQPGVVAAFAVAIGALALTGGLAAACFTKAFGVVFLGLPRRPLAAVPKEGGRAMRWPQAVLAAACVVPGLVPFAGLRLVYFATVEASGLPSDAVRAALVPADAALVQVAIVAGVLLVLVVALAFWRSRLLASRSVRSAPTWGTGYVAPSPRMQYTASSFVAPITTLFRHVLRMQVEPVRLLGYFPVGVPYGTRARGLFREPIVEPFFRGMGHVAMRMRWLQHGRIQLYLANIAAVLLVLLLWKLGV